MSNWTEIKLGTNHGDLAGQEVAVFVGDVQVSKVIDSADYSSYGTLLTFPQFDFLLKSRFKDMEKYNA